MLDADSLLAEILITALTNNGSEATGQEYSELHGFAAFGDFNSILFGDARLFRRDELVG
jgi:hypothetical protein